MKLLVLVTLCALATPARADDGDRWNGGTMALQVAGGTGGLLAGGAIGAAIGYYATRSSSDSYSGVLGLLFGAGLGGFTGLVAGIDLVGDARGSTGHWYGTFGGALIGGGAVAGLEYLKPSSNAGRKVLVVVQLVVFVGASVLGYQATADERAHPPAAQPRLDRIAAAPLVLLTF